MLKISTEDVPVAWRICDNYKEHSMLEHLVGTEGTPEQTLVERFKQQRDNIDQILEFLEGGSEDNE